MCRKYARHPASATPRVDSVTCRPSQPPRAAPELTPAAPPAARGGAPRDRRRRPARAHPPGRRPPGRAAGGHLLGVPAHPAGAAASPSPSTSPPRSPPTSTRSPTRAVELPGTGEPRTGQVVERTLALFQRWLDERELALAQLELSMEATPQPGRRRGARRQPGPAGRRGRRDLVARRQGARPRTAPRRWWRRSTGSCSPRCQKPAKRTPTVPDRSLTAGPARADRARVTALIDGATHPERNRRSHLGSGPCPKP